MSLEIQGKLHLDKTVIEVKDGMESESLTSEKVSMTKTKIVASQATMATMKRQHKFRQKSPPQATFRREIKSTRQRLRPREAVKAARVVLR